MPALSPDQVNSLLVKKLIQDLVIECTSNTQVVVKSGSRAGADDGAVIMQLAGDLTLDITVAGKNGLDTGSEAADTWYYLWMIYNPATEEVAGVLSASATAPTLPSGFTKKRLVGAVRNGSGSDFIPFMQRDTRWERPDDFLFLDAASTTFIEYDPSSKIPTLITGRLLAGWYAKSTSSNSPAAHLSPFNTNTYVYTQLVALGFTTTNLQGHDLCEFNLNTNKTFWAKADAATDTVSMRVRGCILDL